MTDFLNSDMQWINPTRYNPTYKKRKKLEPFLKSIQKRQQNILTVSGFVLLLFIGDLIFSLVLKCYWEIFFNRNPMDTKSLIEKLRGWGTEKNRQSMLAIKPDVQVFGVSETRLDQLAEKIGKNQVLAEELWKSGIVDAQLLACRIAEPLSWDEATVRKWAEQIQFFPVADALMNFIIIPSGWADKLMKPWMDASQPILRRLGFRMLEYRVKNDPRMDNDELLEILYSIERQIHTAPDEVKEAMHRALIAIGERNRVLNTEALIIGMRIGPVIIHRNRKDITLPDAFKILGNKKLKERLKNDNR